MKNKLFLIIIFSLIFILWNNNSFGQTTLFSEDFENGGSIPTGWTQKYESGTVDWNYQAGNTGSVNAAHGGSYNALFQENSFSDETTKLISPVIDFSGYTTNPTLKFWHLQEAWDTDVTELNVYYKTSSGGIWTQIASYTTEQATWAQKTISLPNVNSTYYIAFEGIAKYARGVGIDDVLIEATSDLDPTLTITDVSEQAGNPVTVPVNATDIAGLVGFQWTIEYDDTKLTYIDCDNWNADVTGSITINSSIPGKLMFAYNDYPNEIDIADDVFFDINFTINSGATGDACLSWSDDPTVRELSDAVPDVISATWEAGCVTILPPPPTLIIDNTVLGTAGNPVTVPINALSISGLVGFQWTIEYDDTKLTYVDCDNWDAGVTGAITINSSVSGKLMFAYNDYPNEINIADDVFFNINFTVNSGATGDACLSWSDDPTVRELSDAVPNEITGVTWTNGCITIVLEGYWTGDVSTEWDNTGNWTDAHIPVSGDNATIPDVSAGSNRYPLIEVDAVCANLQIDAGANVQIAPDFSLTVETNLTNNSGVDGLIIKSDATGTGSLIHNTANVDGTVERFFAAPSAQWHYLSMPIKDIDRSLFTANNFYYYNENTEDYWASATDYQGTSGWTNPSGTLENMKGYIYYYNQTTLIYEGKLNYDAAGYNLNADYTLHSGVMTPGTPPNDGPYNAWINYDGWNLMGNPYPCAIDWAKLVTDGGLTDINNTVYFYDDDTDNYKYFNAHSGTDNGTLGLNGGTQYIPVGQGFFVKTDVGGNLNIPLSARVNNTQDFWKSKTQNEGFIRLQTSLGDFSDELIVRTLPDATNEFDGEFDAYKRYSWNADMPQIYSMDIDKNTEYAINTLPEFSETISVPLGYNINASGNFSIKLSENKFENVDVYIEDTYQNKNTLLNELDNYNFDIQAGNSKDRFILHLVKNANNVLDIDNNISVFPNPTTGEFTIYSSKDRIQKVEIVDITGKIISSQNFDDNNCNINITSCASGIYTLKINTINNIYYKKIILN